MIVLKKPTPLWGAVVRRMRRKLAMILPSRYAARHLRKRMRSSRSLRTSRVQT